MSFFLACTACSPAPCTHPAPRRRLIKGAFPPGALPDYLTSPAYYKFAPAEELISLPGDIARTEFRLVATLEGWEYTLCERTLPGAPDPQRRLLVTVSGWVGGVDAGEQVVAAGRWLFSQPSLPACCSPCCPSAPLPSPSQPKQLAEFESDAVVVGERQYVARLLSYPTVCVAREFLDEAVTALAAQAAAAEAEEEQAGLERCRRATSPCVSTA